MKILSIVLGMLAFIPLLSSQSSQTPLAQTIAAKKAEGLTFQTPELFAILPVGGRSDVAIADLPTEVREYELLQLEEENLQELIHKSPESLTLSLPGNGRSPLEVELVRVNLFSEDFKVRTSQSPTPIEVETGLHYRGIIKGDPNSIATVSIFENEVRGLFSSSELGNLVLGKLPPSQGRSPKTENYILYDDRPVAARQDLDCGTPDDGPGYTDDELSYASIGRDANDCVRVYFEVDNDIFRDKGSVSKVTDYVTGLFNEVAALYTNENINVIISEIFIWDTASPYSGTSSGALLSQFQNYRKSFNGEIGQLLSYQASGGIAVLSGLCHPYTWARLSFASINRTYNTVPSYSFTVMVVAHELGHLLGSQHTHACVWNGNNTAIDGCAGFTEGSCSNPGKPAEGGTIMSYCHITSVGINFSLGFGPQPGSVIRSRVSQATCMQTCSSPPPSGGDNPPDNPTNPDDNTGDARCAGNEVVLTLTLDNFGPETSWEIVDNRDQVLYSGGPYAKKKAGTIVRDTFCLDDGCYNFTILDEDGDGICCDYGQGSFILKDAANKTLSSGGDFDYEDGGEFCLGEAGGGDDGSGGGGDCLEIDFSTATIQSYGDSQDQGTFQVVNNGKVLKLERNAWKAIMMDYNITPETVLELEFYSTEEGEIHGIGFDDNSSISYALTFKFYGTQAWGRLDYDNYPGGGTWKKYSIPVGKFYTGEADRLFFACDNDRYPHGGNSYFRNVRIHEGGGCGSALSGGNDQVGLPGVGQSTASVSNFAVYPNPTSRQLRLDLPQTDASSESLVQVYNTTGQLLIEKRLAELVSENVLNVEGLPQGTYLIRYDDGSEPATQRFTILRE
ncbi:MAG: zinc-dependent metalloprotease [Saprospiraceae bacterium]|nr:zinc-dependent metalloprotease [Lewinella sp.]